MEVYQAGEPSKKIVGFSSGFSRIFQRIPRDPHLPIFTQPRTPRTAKRWGAQCSPWLWSVLKKLWSSGTSPGLSMLAPFFGGGLRSYGDWWGLMGLPSHIFSVCWAKEFVRTVPPGQMADAFEAVGQAGRIHDNRRNDMASFMWKMIITYDPLEVGEKPSFQNHIVYPTFIPCCIPWCIERRSQDRREGRKETLKEREKQRKVETKGRRKRERQRAIEKKKERGKKRQ